ncbi:MAG: ATP-binding cassette domain-containing protein [Candidatus Eremiobacteraeota bacterium]|nr:ATP-binding cassette domain-containing protein [Candidatus Eremiobacteraeota bacterium]
MSERGLVAEVKIDISGLSVWYSAAQALYDVRMAIPARKTAALIGAAGSGKTTLLRCIDRLHDLDPRVRVMGSIELDGAEVMAPGTDVALLRRRAGMLFTRPAILPMTIFDNVAYGLRAMGISQRSTLESRCERALREALVWDRVCRQLDRAASSLPVDAAQQLCIARALVLEPDVLLLDDPTRGMDAAAVAAVEAVISALRVERTVLLATNDLQQAARLSDTAWYLARGRVIESGDTTAVFSRPADSRTEQFLSGRSA